MVLVRFHFLSDMGPALSGSNCGFQRSDVPRLRGADAIPGSHPAPHRAPVSHGGAPVFGSLSGGSHHHCGARITG